MSQCCPPRLAVSHLTQCQPSVVLSVTRHFLTLQAMRAINPTCFERPEPRRDASGQSRDSRDIYKQAKGKSIMLLAPVIDCEAPGWPQITTFLKLCSPQHL